MSSPESASRPKTASSPSTNTNTSSPPRRRGGPGGPVPVTRTGPGAASTLNLDMSNLRIEDDTASVASTGITSNTGTTSSSRRRRRRRNKGGAGGAGGGSGALTTLGVSKIPPVPGASKSKGGGGGKKPAKLAIGLDLNVELELKAKIGGDLTLSMVLEEKPKPRSCPELPFPGEGEELATELFYIRVGTLRFRRRWIDPDAVLRGQIFLTASSALLLLGVGFVLGWFASRVAVGGGGGLLGPPAISFGSGYGHGHELGGVVVAAPEGRSRPWLDGVIVGDDWCECDCDQVYDTGLGSGALKNSSSLY